MSSQFPQYHFQLYTSYPEENQIQRKGKCVKVCPEVHYNMNKQFVIKPGQSIIAILCNNHANDNSCLIPFDETDFVHFKLNNKHFTNAIVVPRMTSIWKLLCHKDISYTPHVIFDTPIPLKN